VADQPFQKATADTPLNIRASDWNALCDAARSVGANRMGREGSATLLREALNASQRVYVTYAGGDLAEFSILTYPANSVAPGIDPAVNPLEVQRTPVFAAVAPTSALDPVLILSEPHNGSTGGTVRAIFAGIAVCDVNVTLATHGFAAPVSGDTAKLTSGVFGPARILYKPSGTGVKRCIVELLDQYPTGFFARLTTASSGLWKWYKQKWTGSAWADDGGESPAFNAAPSTLDGTNTCNPVAGLRVWMWPSVTAGYYEFLPTGYTNYLYPGMVSANATAPTDAYSSTPPANLLSGEQVLGSGPKATRGPLRVNVGSGVVWAPTSTVYTFVAYWSGAVGNPYPAIEAGYKTGIGSWVGIAKHIYDAIIDGASVTGLGAPNALYIGAPLAGAYGGEFQNGVYLGRRDTTTVTDYAPRSYLALLDVGGTGGAPTTSGLATGGSIVSNWYCSYPIASLATIGNDEYSSGTENAVRFVLSGQVEGDGMGGIPSGNTRYVFIGHPLNSWSSRVSAKGFAIGSVLGGATDGDTGTDCVGNVFEGGIVTNIDSSGWTGSFVLGDGSTVSVVTGKITAVTPP
jgi:hypothetical protein